MDTYIFRFSAKQLKSIEPELLGLLIASGFCCNELATLMPFIVFEHSLKGANETESAFIVLRRFTVDRIIISKIIEYDEMCKAYFQKPRGTHARLIDEMSANY